MPNGAGCALRSGGERHREVELAVAGGAEPGPGDPAAGVEDVGGRGGNGRGCAEPGGGQVARVADARVQDRVVLLERQPGGGVLADVDAEEPRPEEPGVAGDAGQYRGLLPARHAP